MRCLNKRSYDTIQMAKRELKLIYKTDQRNAHYKKYRAKKLAMRTYLCPDCGKYHLTSQKKYHE